MTGTGDTNGRDRRRHGVTTTSSSSRLVVFVVVALIIGAVVGYEVNNASVVVTPATRTVTSTVTSTTTTTTVGPANNAGVNGSLVLAVDQNGSIVLVNGAWDGGYLWLVTSMTHPNVIEPVANYTYVPPHNATLLGGPAEMQIFTFRALKVGNTTATLELVRPWQMNDTVGRYALHVVVVVGP